MACCGSTCSISTAEFADATIEGHSFTISIASNEIDVRNFGSGAFGDWLACSSNGTISVNSYVRPVVTVGTDVTFACNVCSETLSVPATVTGQDINVDAQGVVEFVTNLRMEGALSIA